MTNLSVRKAELGDAHWVDALGLAEGLSVDLEAELALPQGRAWVWPRAGFLTAWLVADELQIQDLAVRPAERGRGLARTLLEAACADARDEGAREVTLELRASNERALRLYLGSGFERVGERPRYYPDGETALLLTKRLDPSAPRAPPPPSGHRS